MAKDTIAVPKSIVVTIIGCLIISVVSFVVYWAKGTESSIHTNQQAIMAQDKAVGIIQEWEKGHEKNKSAHHTDE
ncbi:hypothetical protein LCGC14_1078190 [marine sediment metagenome]|uniref:Uncharacterized protein n=1 Tax=marine sediment metagenome TaxID=412755 RepID=A0A0F9MKX5_9ZZZZ